MPCVGTGVGAGSTVTGWWYWWWYPGNGSVVHMVKWWVGPVVMVRVSLFGRVCHCFAVFDCLSVTVMKHGVTEMKHGVTR